MCIYIYIYTERERERDIDVLSSSRKRTDGFCLMDFIGERAAVL